MNFGVLETLRQLKEDVGNSARAQKCGDVTMRMAAPQAPISGLLELLIQNDC
jgi:hypothetical protein